MQQKPRHFRGPVLAAALVLAACSTPPRAPVVDRGPERQAPPAPTVADPKPARPAEVRPADTRPQTYTVQKGDTLVRIALEQGIAYRDLAQWNGIQNPNVIRVGQVLRLTDPKAPPPAPASAATAAPLKAAGAIEARPLEAKASEAKAAEAKPVEARPAAAQPDHGAPPEGLRTEPRALKLPWSEQALAQVQRKAEAPKPAIQPAVAAVPPSAATEKKPEPQREADDDDRDRVDWAWPAQGKVIAGFTPGGKGVDIAGKAGQPVIASAAGKVVYSGAGLRGYGNLIIIKHNAVWFSAYAHSSRLLVKEGESVARGQKIAEMGDTDADQVKLHFEIRRYGQPVDPLKHLPG